MLALLVFLAVGARAIFLDVFLTRFVTSARVAERYAELQAAIRAYPQIEIY